MKTTTLKLPTTVSALLVAVFMLSLLPAAAMASGSHYKFSFDKEWTKKDRMEKSWSKKHRSAKGCAKKGCDNSLSIPLYVKGDNRVGKVTVRLEGGDLKVQYQMNDGWYIKQTNLDIADSYNGLHLTPDGSPDVEAFVYNSKHFTPVKSADYTINAGQWVLGTELYIAAQAIVINKTSGKCDQHSAKGGYAKIHDDTHAKSFKHKKSHSKKGESHDKHYRDHDYDEKHYGHDHEDHDQKDHANSVEKEAWALGEKFPSQQLAGYFTYMLESCDPVEQSVIQFSDAIYTVNEGDLEAVITVLRSGNVDQAASVEFTTTDGSAMNGVDYEFASGVLNFAAGQISAEFSVKPIDDTDIESVETVALQLSNPSNATLGQQNTSTLEIEDNDVAAASIIAIDRIVPNPVEESKTVTVYVTRTGNLSVDATVEFGTIDGTAIGGTQCGAPTAPFDYEHVGGTLFFDAGVAELSIVVTTCNNSPRGDTTETFDIEIYNPMGAELADDGDNNPNSNIETITILDLN
ncbi:MAG: hypothetical protein LJE85_01545 [Gammaproteobacteria bacterium]|nr:hypothetical protein [Gammaproteobacteria bacterium]